MRVVEGTVRGPDDEPVEGARIMIEAGPVPIPDIAALTGDDGRFTMAVPAAGSYRFACAAGGFGTIRIGVEVTKETVRVEIRLTPEV